ncbi:MAG: winged helix-turn-helix transcriptional regulator [Oligoflexia bacterium]|nr:winged helix-turn-helix transcriptional regulator [Oligoflexia bacterium]
MDKCHCDPSEKYDSISTGSKEKNRELALLCKALAHPARVQILKLLVRKQSCICGEIVDQIEDLAQSTVSQHLKILKDTGLIRGEIEGTAVCYCIEPSGLRRLRVLIADI